MNSEKGIQVRIYISPQKKVFDSLNALGNPRAVRERIKHLVMLGIKYEESQDGAVTTLTKSETDPLHIDVAGNSGAGQKKQSVAATKIKKTTPVVKGSYVIEEGTVSTQWNIG